MKAQHKTKEVSQINPLFSDRRKENKDTRLEIYRMINFLNKIEGPGLKDLFEKFNIQFTDTDKDTLKRRRNQNFSKSIPSLN